MSEAMDFPDRGPAFTGKTGPRRVGGKLIRGWDRAEPAAGQAALIFRPS